MTIGAVETLLFRGKWLVNERILAIATLETFFMPVLIFVGQVLKENEYC